MCEIPLCLRFYYLYDYNPRNACILTGKVFYLQTVQFDQQFILVYINGNAQGHILFLWIPLVSWVSENM